MTLSTTSARISYSGNGSTTAFAFPYRFLLNADLIVILRDSSGNEAVQVITSQYAVTGATLDAGGTVTMVTAPASGYTLLIYRDPARTQLTHYNNSDSFPATSHETALDKLTMLVQRLADRFSRVPSIKESSTYSNLTFPEPEASKILQWKADLTGLENIANTTLAPNSYAVATQSEAEGGILNTVLMTPLRALQTMFAWLYKSPPLFPTRAAAVAATIPTGVSYIRLAGYTSAGDGGGALYTKISTPSPVKAWHLQSADGAYWRLTEDWWTPQMLGAAGNDSANDYQAVYDCVVGADTLGANVRINKTYYGATHWKFTDIAQNGLIIEGAGNDRSQLRSDDATPGPVLWFFNSSNGTCSNWLTLKNFALNGASVAGSAGLLVDEAKDYCIDGVKVRLVKSHGIQVGSAGLIDCLAGEIKNCRVSPASSPSASAKGFYLPNGTTIKLSGNYCSGAWPFGLWSAADTVSCNQMRYEGCTLSVVTGGSNFTCLAAYHSTIGSYHYTITGNSQTTIKQPRGTTLSLIDQALVTDPKWVDIHLEQSGSAITTRTLPLCIVRGRIDTTTPTILQGQGFTVASTGTGAVTVTFTTAFSGVPTVTATCDQTIGSTGRVVTLAAVPTTTTAQFRRATIADVAQEGTFTFIAIGFIA